MKFYMCRGVISTGITCYIQGVKMKDRGPVFVTAFIPLAMVNYCRNHGHLHAQREYDLRKVSIHQPSLQLLNKKTAVKNYI